MSAAPASQWFATCPKGLESLLANELSALGAIATRETVAGVYFDGPLALAYRACLWSRLANRILRPVASFEVRDADQLYEQLNAVDWGAMFGPRNSFAIDFSGQNEHIRNTQFGAQRSKDAVVDWFVVRRGQRPGVDKRNPDVRLNIRLVKTQLHLALDFSGRSLHQRGYRLRGGAAPLKENLAAALLLRADWPGIAARGGALIDPMCGSATLLLEGAMMAADIAPGLARAQFGFEHLHGHNARQWQAIVSDARSRAERGRQAQLPDIRGYDADAAVIRVARENIARIGLEKVVRVSCRPLAQLQKPSHKPLPLGLLICNPPYGERLGEKRALLPLYRQLGALMLREFPGWQAAIFTSDLDLGRATGLRSHKRYALFNGSIASSLLLFDLAHNELRGCEPAGGEAQPKAEAHTARPDKAEARRPIVAADSRADSAAQAKPGAVAEPTAAAAPTSRQTEDAETPLSPGAQMFANRIVKNRKRLAAWVRREQISCYRLYDADMPEYAVAVDMYSGEVYGGHGRVDQVHVAEYQAPRGVDPQAAACRLDEVRAALPAALGIPANAIVYKQRRRQRGDQQYQKRGSRGELLSVREGAAKLLVNLHDYLDTGLFLDHRPLRLRIAREARERDFLNLFCYTGAATVHAALGGARTTTSVDMSNTYLAWLRRNLAHNDLDESRNHLVRANCVEWLAAPHLAGSRPSPHQYDLVLLDPPSFSNSSRMGDSFDVQRDHAGLIRGAMGVLRETGQLYFSNNLRGFRLDAIVGQEYLCEEITAATLDPDFQRNRRIHNCWSIRHRPPG